MRPWPDILRHSLSKDWQCGQHGRGGKRSSPHAAQACTRSSPRRAWSQNGAPSASVTGDSIGGSTPQEQRGGGDALAGGDEAGGGAGNLGGAGAAELLDALGDEVEPVDVGLAEPAATRVQGQPPADLQRAALRERPALAPAAEAVALQGERYQRRERVVDLRDVHILWGEVGVLPQVAGGGPGGAGERVVVPVVDHAVVLGGQALRGGVDVDGGAAAVTGTLRGDDDAGQRPVRLKAVVEQAQGLADPPGGHVHLAGQGPFVHDRGGVLVRPVAAGEG